MNDSTINRALKLLTDIPHYDFELDNLEYHLTKSAVHTIVSEWVKPYIEQGRDLGGFYFAKEGRIGTDNFHTLFGVAVVQHENDDPEMLGVPVQLRRKAVSND